MRIDDPKNLEKLLPAPTPADAGVQPANGQPSSSGSITVSGDRAELSNVAGRLSEMLQPDSAATERLCHLREAVANGTYQVDAASVSRALVDQAINANSLSRKE